MPRPKRQDIEDITELATELEELIDELISRYSDHSDVKGELKALKVYAHILSEKPEKIARLRDFKGYKFAVIGDNGEPRPATNDEAMRLIMGYQRGNILEIYQQWTVVNGEWVKRPEINPDGSEVRGRR